MAGKEFIRADALMKDSFTLAKRIYDSGFRPDMLVVLWRGGAPVGMAIHEFLLYKGIRADHTVIKVESYTGIGRRTEPQIENIAAVLDALKPDSRVLVVDDISDSGSTLHCVCECLRTSGAQIRTATLYLKETGRRIDIVPDYYLRRTDRWIVFPHELMDLTPDEIREKDAYVAGLLV
ncbi:MAG: phosphoribosyltransferase family protein [bacterium]